MILPADHLLTLEEWKDLPEDNSRRYEPQDGVLIPNPHPGVLHQVAATRFGLRATDTILKPVAYARAGMPHYWLIELEPAVLLSAYRLDGDAYQLNATAVETFEGRGAKGR